MILERFIDEIEAAGKGNGYDVVVGVSGGCDSSWILAMYGRCSDCSAKLKLVPQSFYVKYTSKNGI